jgi:uncharacterized protein (DUF433 family)
MTEAELLARIVIDPKIFGGKPIIRDKILARAYLEQRVPVTLDKDFGELAIVHGRPRPKYA